jgi:hypothetical protein
MFVLLIVKNTNDTWRRSAAISLLKDQATPLKLHETQKPPRYLTLLYRQLAFG